MSAAMSGFRAWLIQRITAVLLVIGSCLLLSLFFVQPVADYTSWQEWIQKPLPVIAMLLFGVAIAMHAWVGIRDVIMDYIHSATQRVAFLTVLAVYLLGNLFWLIWILL